MKLLAFLMVSLLAGAAHAGALDECYQKTSNRSEVGACLSAARSQALAEEKSAVRGLRASLVELQKISSARGLVAALTAAERHFDPYMKSQCDLVRATYASGTGAAQAGLACEVDALRARSAELKLMTPVVPAKN